MAKQKKQKTNMGKVRPKIFHKMTSFRDALHQILKPTLSEHLYLALPPAFPRQQAFLCAQTGANAGKSRQ